MVSDPRERQVLCLGGGDGPGCLHPVDWHTGPGTPAPDCECCSWRKATPRQEPARTPPPPGMPVEKWSVMNRRERRAWMRGKRK